MLRRSRAAATPARARTPRATALPMLYVALAGACSLFSFEPFGWWPVQLPLLAFLFYQVGIDTSIRRATWLGWAFGFGWSVAGMHWLYITMNRFGHIPSLMAVAAVCLLGAYMGLFGAFATGVASWLRRRWSLPVTSFLLLVLPVMWSLSEWMRGWVLTGFPWAVSGYAHNISPLAGYAPLLGVYGIGLLVALCASCLTMLTQRARWPAIGLLCVIMLAGFGLARIEWTTPFGKPLSVRLLQGNVAQDEKFSAEHVEQALTLYRDLITAAPADLIATPETAIVGSLQQLPPDYLPALTSFAHSSGSTLMLGIPLSDTPHQYANSVAAVNPAGQTYRYDKHHLVPFGEFVPTGFRWFVDLMAIPLGEMKRGGTLQAPFPVKDQLVLPNICYEDVFGEEIAAQLRSTEQPASVLLNMSNLAWYGESVAIAQHLQISQMRTLETGRPMLRSTNTGATAVVDGRGHVVSRLSPYVRGTLAANVQGMTGLTPYIRFGNASFLLLAALALAAAWLSGKKSRKSASNGRPSPKPTPAAS
jgi:apolipoprotein N-acyltransferase